MLRYRILLLILIAGGAIGALMSGGSFLEATLPGGLPLGNALVPVALCAIAGAAFALSPPRSPPRYASVVSLLAACSWLPVSIALAGNLALNFSGTRGDTWAWLTLATAVAPLASLAWAAFHRMKAGARRSADRLAEPGLETPPASTQGSST